MKYIPFGKTSPPVARPKRWKGALQYGICAGAVCILFMIGFTVFLSDDSSLHPKIIFLTSLVVIILFGFAGFFNGPFHIEQPSDKTKPKSHFE